MALDPALADALRAATAEAGQPEGVAKRLIAWLTHMSDGELSRETHAQLYDETRQTLKLEEGGDAH
jgi:hypothetical protein